MNILFVSALLPYPLYSGGQIRIYNLLKHLGQKHTITLCSFIRNEEEKQWIGNLSFCKHVTTVHRGGAWQPRYLLASILGRYPLLFSTYANQAMAEMISWYLNNHTYDLIHLEPGYVWPSLPNTSVPVVVAEHNIEHTIYEGYVRSFPIVPLRPFLFADVLKLRYWERHVWKSASHVVAVSRDDKNEIARHRPPDTVSIVPNGVDTDSIRPDVHKKNEKAAHTFLFVGNFAWIQNRDAIRWLVGDIWPSIHTRFPSSKLRVVGRGMPGDVRKLIDTNTTVLLEHVEDIRDEYARADILLAPIRIGGGTKFKVLEAMAAGIPVVTTSAGAAGLDVTDKEHLSIAVTAQDFLRCTEEFLTNKQYKASVVRNARVLVEKHYEWGTIARKLEHVWKTTYEAHS